VSYNGARSDSSPVWDLFSERHRVMDEMTAMVARQVSNAGVVAA